MARPPTPLSAAPWRWATAGALCGALVMVVVAAPAHWLAAGVAAATRGQVQLLQPRGTVWDGSARLALTGGAGSSDQAALPGRLAWRLRPAWMGARLVATADCCTAQPLALRIGVRIGAIAIDVADGQTQWPASLTTGLGTPWNTLQLDGDLRLSTQGLSVEWVEGRPTVRGQAELVARQMSSRLSTLRPMGSYRITLQGGAPTTLRLDTLEGSLQLSGQGQWVGSRLRFSGEARAAAEREAALSNLLNIIGRRNGARSLISIG
ncbi:type II secretion system protein N [Ramlibacter sp.]|uniref:type II secretion system protein N n=1 Tax=Ramlibacter sp. TaxID=1917967 RepID=UPI0035B178CD